jgi:hypothetical protein
MAWGIVGGEEGHGGGGGGWLEEVGCILVK